MSEEADSISILRLGLRHVDLNAYVDADDLLGRSPLLAFLSESERRDLLGRARVQKVSPGHTILREGESSPGLYLLLSGSVTLLVEKGLTDLGRLGKGDFFGLSALFPDAVRPQASAEDEVQVALLPAEQLGVLMQVLPALAEHFREVSRTRKARAEDGADFLGKW